MSDTAANTWVEITLTGPTSKDKIRKIISGSTFLTEVAGFPRGMGTVSLKKVPHLQRSSENPNELEWADPDEENNNE